MKNQNDLIVIGVCSVLAIAAALIFFFTKREPVAPTPVSPVVTTKLAYPSGGDPQTGLALPGGGSSMAGGGGGAGMVNGMGSGKAAFMSGGGASAAMGGLGGSRGGGAPNLGGAGARGKVGG